VPGVARRVGRYEIRREIGRGGMAVVYLARQTDLDRNVALKELGALQAMDPAFAARFLHESRIAGSLTHPNIITVHDYFEYGGLPYIAMEYLERGSLRPHVGTLTLPQIAGVFEGLLAGLAYAEAQRVVHRDLKPENVMITAEGSVKIADFGIAKAFNLASTGRFLTATGSTVGTPTYMAPEQAMAKKLGAWTDLYSVGVMAYELLVGQVPFPGDTPMAILLSHVKDDVPPALSVNPDLDPGLAQWIDHLLQKAPEDRPQRAHDAWFELEEITLELLGPRWRRDARILEPAQELDTPKPLTPAPFSEEAPALEPAAASGAPADAEGEPETERPRFETFHRPSVQPQPQPQPPPEPAVVEPAVAERSVAEPWVAEAVVAESAPAPEIEVPEMPSAMPPAKVAAPREAAAAFEQPSVFETYNPPPAAAPVEDEPVQPTPPPLERVPLAAEPPHEPVRAPAVASPGIEPLPTVPPMRAPHLPSYQFPVAGTRSRRRLGVGAGLIVAALGAAGVGYLLLGGDRKSNVEIAEGAVDSLPVGLERASLAVAGQTLYVATSRGRLIALSRPALKRRATLSDPAAPTAVATVGSKIFVADAQAVTAFRRKGLARAGVAAGGTSAVAAETTGAAAVATVVGASRGRLCVLRAAGVGPCVRLAFAPAGVGAAPGGRFFVANAAAGTILPYHSSARLAKQRPIALGRRASPHGRMIAFAGSLYVPVHRGVAVVDLAKNRRVRTIALPATPSDIWIVPFNGRLFATLYAKDAVGVVDVLAAGGTAHMVGVARRPVAASGALTSSGSGDVVYVLSAEGTITRLDALTGNVLGRTHVALGAPASRAVVRDVRFGATARVVRVTIGLRIGRVYDSSLTVRDGTTGDGHTAVALWQGGIATAVGRAQGKGLKVRLGSSLGRLEISVSAAAGAFTSMWTEVAPDGRSVVLRFTRKAKPQKPNTTTTTTTTVTTTPLQVTTTHATTRATTTKTKTNTDTDVTFTVVG